MNLIKAAHAAGKHYEWNVTEPEVHLTCNDAWIAYTNRGSLQDESGTKSLTWLESAFLHKEGTCGRSSSSIALVFLERCPEEVS